VPKKVEQINDHLFIDTYKCIVEYNARVSPKELSI